MNKYIDDLVEVFEARREGDTFLLGREELGDEVPSMNVKDVAQFYKERILNIVPGLDESWSLSICGPFEDGSHVFCLIRDGDTEERMAIYRVATA